MTMLSYREAATRVRRSRRTIRYWKLQGMRMGWEVRNGQMVRVVDEDTLIAWWQQRMDNDPVWQNRIRAKIVAAQQADTPIANQNVDTTPFATPTLMVVQVSDARHHTDPQR
jgi:transposase